MKIRKLLLCVLSSLLVVGVSGISAFAAETEDTDVQTQEVSTEDEAADTEAAEIEETAEEVEEDTIKLEKSVEAKGKKITYTKAELRLLSALIFCEAGSEPYAGKLAVGIVVVNRKESKKFPGSIKEVIYQKYQFGPARNGSLTKALSHYDNGSFTSDNEKDCIKAAKAALSGEKDVSYKGKTIDLSSYLYFSGRVSGARLTIANHQFK